MLNLLKSKPFTLLDTETLYINGVKVVTDTFVLLNEMISIEYIMRDTKITVSSVYTDGQITKGEYYEYER